MLRALCIVSALLVAANALPTTLPDGEVQHLTEEISQAKGDLEGMVKENEKEISDMDAIKNDIDNTGPAISAVKEQETISAAAKDMQLREENAVADENEQQTLALDSLSQVNKALEQINGKNALGESQTNPVEAAVQKLSKLQKQLEVGTSTSHNLERIEQMQEKSKQLVTDAKDLAKFAKMSAPGELGESKMNAQQKQIEEDALAQIQKVKDTANAAIEKSTAAAQQGGVMGMLNSARTSAEPAQAAPAEAAAPAQGGVMGMLNSARTSAETAQAAGESRADRMLSQEQETLAQLGDQEAMAVKAEKVSIKQLKGMINDMA